MTDIRNNNLEPIHIAELAIRLVEGAGGINDDYGFMLNRAGRGWTASEIARAYVRTHFPKGNRQRRTLLVGLTKQGAKA